MIRSRGVGRSVRTLVTYAVLLAVTAGTGLAQEPMRPGPLAPSPPAPSIVAPSRGRAAAAGQPEGGGSSPASPAAAVEAARALLRRYDEDPTAIDRARDLLEAEAAREGSPDPLVLTALARAWFLVGEQRAPTDAARLAAYARGRDVARRAAELAPNDADAHLWYAITLGSWANARGLLSSALALRTLRAEIDTVLRLDPQSIQAHLIAGSINRELPALFGGDRAKAEAHFRTARALDPHLTGARLELALLYIDMGRTAEARRELQGLLEETAPSDRARFTRYEAPRARALLESLPDRP